jgi:type I restriction enzyme S subunit
MKDLKIKFRWETEFKETEIGEIPKEWEMSKIGVFYKLKYGITANSGEFGNCRLLRQTDLKESFIDISSVPYSEVSEDEIQKYLLKDDDLVISRIANVGSIGYVSFEVLNSLDKPLIFGSYLLKFEKTKEIHNKFTFYFLLSPQMQDYIKSIADGSTRQNTNAKVVAEFPLYVPPLPEQSRIATVLSYFDDLIEVKKRQNEILEKTVMAIFKSWFIDFEPFRDGDFVYSEELGKEIPKGWEVKRWGEVVKIESGGSAPQKEEYFIGGKNPFVRVKHLTNYPCVEEADFINDEAVKQYNLKLYNEGSIIFQRSGESLSFGRVNILPFNAYIVNHLAVIPNLPSSKLLMEFLFFTLKNILIELIEERSGTALPYIRISDIEKKEILLPPSQILQSFHSLVEPLFQKIILNQKQIMTIRKIRDTLLPLLVFGKLRVEEV